ncbi:MAG TPA: hypothetical protein VIG51_11765 [Candidatus Baltobacteraceae bacterium]
MLVPIDRRRRVQCVRLSVVLCASALLLAPLAGQGSIEIGNHDSGYGVSLQEPRPPVTVHPASLEVNRDPFVADRPAFALEPVPIPPSEAALPPNRGAAGVILPATAFSPVGSIAVRAIISGPRARALVEDNGVVRVVGAGDTVGGRRIRRIDNLGVMLSSGDLLTLAGDGP